MMNSDAALVDALLEQFRECARADVNALCADFAGSIKLGSAARASLEAMLLDVPRELLLPSMAVQYRLAQQELRSVAAGMAQAADEQEFFRRFAMDSDAWLEDLCLAKMHKALVNAGEALRRLVQHREDLEALGYGGLDVIADIEPAGSETHNGGRRAVIIRLGGGRRLVYKPVNLGLQRAFAAVTGLLGGNRFLKAVRVLCAGPDYGFMEFIPPAEGGEEAGPFFYRSGVLLAMAHWLRITDMHHENVIASAGHPVAIDLEMMLHRYTESEPDIFTTGLVAENPATSGIRGGGDLRQLYTHAEQDERGNVRVKYRRPVWRAANRISDGKGLQHAGRFGSDVVKGFVEGYSRMQKRARDILAVLQDAAAEGLRIRHLPRTTMFYGYLQVQLTQPVAQDAAAARKRVLQRLEGAGGMEALFPPELIAREKQDLLQGDVPYFWSDARSLALEHVGGRVQHRFFACTALEQVEEWFGLMGPEDMRRQCARLETWLQAE